MSVRTYEARDRFAFDRVAAEFARTIRPGDAVGLVGELGSGKTTFVRAVVRTLHGEDSAASPTFVFRHRYEGYPPIEHLDLYRVESSGEIAELGLDDAFRADAVTFVEWPERAPHLLPDDALVVRIAGSGPEPRRITLERHER